MTVDWGGIAVVVGVVTTLAGAGGTVVKVLSDRRSGISSDERQVRQDAASDRRDTIADRDAWIQRLTDEVAKLGVRLDAVEGISVARSDFIDVLEAHIWAGKPPPPPARPEGV